MTNSLKEKYKQRIKAELANQDLTKTTSKEYGEFLGEFTERPMTLYERACDYAGKTAKISPDKKTAENIEKACNLSRLQVTPTGVYSFGIVAPLILVIFLGIPTLLLVNSLFLFILVLIGGLGIIAPLLNMPFYITDNFRLKASNQMVLSIFYLVTYMRHTSNLERAVEFASDHLSEPLASEFRKILWDVETGKFDSVSDSIENFLEKWKDTNPEFIDAVHLIESSLLESSEKRRLELLDKSLDVILDETFEKMLHYAHNLQSPITTLHMLGVILPILGLVILPLMLSFIPEVQWYHISVVYNIFLPVVVLLFGLQILSKRPTGYGDTSLKPENTELQKAANYTIKIGSFDTKITPKQFLITFMTIFVLIGISPLIMRVAGVEDFGFGDVSQVTTCGRAICFLDYRLQEATIGDFVAEAREVGPFGLGASVASLFVILGIGLGLGLYFTFKTTELIKIFDKTKKLENEFSAALFQLGNRLGDNIPAEIAALKVAEIMPDTPAGRFFTTVAINIQKLGMSIQEAIFNSKVGAIIFYPSNLIESSMKVLIQAVKKGPLIASNAVINISRYVKEMRRVEDRLTDLMAEVISSMKSQISFLTPIISAIVVGLTSMISTIIGTLSAGFDQFGEDFDGGATAGIGGGLETLTDFFQGGMPTFYFQLIVGLYVIQITILLTIMINTIQRGSDPVHRDYLLGQNLTKSILLYVVTTAVVMIVFNIVTISILPAVG